MTGGDMNKCDFLIVDKWSVLTLGRTSQLVQYFLNDQSLILQNSSVCKIQSTRQTNAFKVREYERFIAMISDSTLN